MTDFEFINRVLYQFERPRHTNIVTHEQTKLQWISNPRKKEFTYEINLIALDVGKIENSVLGIALKSVSFSILGKQFLLDSIINFFVLQFIKSK